MRIVKIKYRNPDLDTKYSWCINNFLWNKEKCKVINNGTELLVPKFYTARHVCTLSKIKKANAKYRCRNPLQMIKANHESHVEYIHKIRSLPRERTPSYRDYDFRVKLTETEYKLLWDFLYKEVRNPLDVTSRKIKTIEELKAQEKKDKKKGKKNEE